MPTTRVLTVTSKHSLHELQTAHDKARSIVLTVAVADGEEKIRLFPRTLSLPDWTDQVIVSGGCDSESGKLYYRPDSESGVIELTPYW